MPTPIRGRDIILTDEAWKAIRFASPADVRLGGALSLPILPLPAGVANSASAVSINDVQIASKERMAVVAVGLSGVQCSTAKTSKNVLHVGYYFEVIRVHARRLPAKVIEYVSHRDRSVPILEIRPMRAALVPVPIRPAIPVLVEAELPYPAKRLIAAIFFAVGRIGIRSRSSVVPLEEPHRYTKNPAQFGSGGRSRVRGKSATTLAQLHYLRPDDPVPTLTLKRSTTRLAARVSSHATAVRSRNVGELASRLRDLAQGTAFFGKLARHCSGPLAVVSRPRWLHPRGGVFVPQLYQNALNHPEISPW